MDAQMKRGFLEACVLATLCRRESYGYQIVKDVPDILGLTESTLYPLLKRLEAAGSIVARSAEHNGRLRKYYRTTDAGRAKLDEFLREKNEVAQVYRYVEEASQNLRADGLRTDNAADACAGGASCARDGGAHDARARESEMRGRGALESEGCDAAGDGAPCTTDHDEAKGDSHE